MATVSQTDKDLLPMCRTHVTQFLERMAVRLSTSTGRLLEIGPQDRSEVRERLGNFTIDTLDLVDTHRPTYVGDITRHNEALTDDMYDGVVCLEVLEHALDPFGAIREIRRILKHGGFLLLSAPLNFRIHGPIPDCWRFTEHGWKVLLRDCQILEMDILETPGRELFPVHYNVWARNDKNRRVATTALQFRFID